MGQGFSGVRASYLPRVRTAVRHDRWTCGRSAALPPRAGMQGHLLSQLRCQGIKLT